MNYCFDLIDKKFDIPKLVCEIAERVKTEASYGVHTARITNLTLLAGKVTVEFHISGTEYATFTYRLDVPYFENAFRELISMMGCREEAPYWDEFEFREFLKRIVENNKENQFKIHHNFDSLVILGKAI